MHLMYWKFGNKNCYYFGMKDGDCMAYFSSPKGMKIQLEKDLQQIVLVFM